MALDVLTSVLSYALVYAGVYYGPSTDLKVNWTAINATTWWGPAAQQASQDIAVKPMKITYEPDMLTDLKSRLTRNITYVAPLEGVAFRYGFSADALPEWLTYWASKYDFEGRLTTLNSFPLFTTNIQGLNITFHRITPKNDKNLQVLTLLMLHGYPSSPVEFFDAITNITSASIPDKTGQNKFVIEVIAPHLPGFGFSSGATKPGLGAAQIAVVMNSLMQRLGISKYYVHGSDFGSIIGSDMATLFPSNVRGYHTTWPGVFSPIAYGLQLAGSLVPSFLTDAKTYNRTYPNYDIYSRVMDGIAYVHWLATKPDTAGIPLTDSAAGLLAWVLDIFAHKTTYDGIYQNDGGLSALNKDKLLDNMMLYWVSSPMTTSSRTYADTFNKAQFTMRLDEIPTQVPTYAVQTQNALTYQPYQILKLKYPMLYGTEILNFGGQFLGYENPEALAKSIIKAMTLFQLPIIIGDKTQK